MWKGLLTNVKKDVDKFRVLQHNVDRAFIKGTAGEKGEIHPQFINRQIFTKGQPPDGKERFSTSSTAPITTTILYYYYSPHAAGGGKGKKHPHGGMTHAADHQ